MLCAPCGAEAELLTPYPNCDSALYCSKDCSAAQWSRHKYACRLGRPLDEADDFFLACQTEEFPAEDKVARAFGLLYFISAADRHRLFRLYCKLVNRRRVAEEELRTLGKATN